MLSNKVSEIMTTNLTTASVASSIQEVLEMMVAADVGRIIVTSKEVPVGIFTEKDVMKRVVNNNSDPRKSLIKEVMTSPIRAVREETHIIEAFGKMYRGNTAISWCAEREEKSSVSSLCAAFLDLRSNWGKE